MMDIKGKYLPVWGRYKELFQKESITNSEAGILIRAMIAYHFDGEQPNLPEKLEGYWYFLSMDMDDAQSSYEAKVQNGKKGGLRSGEARREKAREKEAAAVREEASEREGKQYEAEGSEMNQKEQITRTGTRTESRTESRTGTKTESRTETRSNTNTDTGSAPASDEAGISCGAKAYGEYGWVKLRPQEYRRLEKQMGFAALQRCISYVDESAQSTGNKNRWKDWSLILRRCYEGKWYEKNLYGGGKSVPMGATGYLGQAELEAIRQVLRVDISDVDVPGETGTSC